MPSSPTPADCALAALAALASGDTAEEAAWLREQALALGGIGWPDVLPDCEGPQRALADALRFTLAERLSLALAAEVEVNPMAGRAVAWLQAPLGGSRPTLGLLASAVAEGHPVESVASGAAVGCGALVLRGAELPLAEQTLGVPLPVLLALRDRDGAWPGASLGESDPVPLPPSVLNEAQRHAAALGNGSAMVLRTGSQAEGRAVAAALADALGRRPVFLTERAPLEGLVPWMLLRALIPVFVRELGPGERFTLPALPLHDGPVLVVTGPDGRVESPAGAVIQWTLPIPPREERAGLWRVALAEGGPSALAEEMAAAHRHGAGRIAHLARLGAHRCAMQGRAALTREDLLHAAWDGEGDGPDGLAQPMRDRIPDDALILSPSIDEELGLLLKRCEAREALGAGLGPSAKARYRHGVCALMVGPSGTGKTLAASWLATRLGLPLYRVDLASVLSKYIGETEKNLSQLLARAEQAEVILLFDEADALFGKRTEVRHANDRFANAQTNYLLQRIERYEGIVLLTSNSRSRFDEAFTRRLDAIVEFPAPGPEERRALWRAHLGAEVRLTTEQLNRLSATAELCGGHIRNVVFTAATLAHAAGTPIGWPELMRGLKIELRKLGRPMPAALKPPRPPRGVR
ncbi:MAG: ATP-binding protein [Alphaproteobacteria bacterium]|nr:ATP-binding protein [Alphaproteobacteria bacterium]